MRKTLFFVSLVFTAFAVLGGEELLDVKPADLQPGIIKKVYSTETYSVVERADFSRYDNGKYTGHTYREVRSSVKSNGKNAKGEILFDGVFIVLEETVRDMRKSAREVNAVVPAKFSMNENGALFITHDAGFPALRGFPLFPKDPARPGLKWSGEGERSCDPLNSGANVIVPLIAEYEYMGVEDYREIPCYRIHAKYASRFGNYRSINDAVRSSGAAASARNVLLAGVNTVVDEDERFVALNGTHDVDIMIKVEDGNILFARDKLDETYMWENGNRVRFTGFTLTFGGGGVSGETINDDIKKIPDVEYKTVPEGIKLFINNLQFRADSDELLAGDAPRLSEIAALLKAAGDKTYLVEGHTARAGESGSDEELSKRRAKRIVNELSSRGIPEEKFVYKGWGSAKPIGDNETEDGRAKNRRVEITILG